MVFNAKGANATAGSTISAAPAARTTPQQQMSTRGAVNISRAPGAQSPANSPWSSGRTNLLKQTLAKSRAPTQINAAASTAALASQIGQMNLGSPPAQTPWDPSQGPTHSNVDLQSMAAWRAKAAPQSFAGSAVTTRYACYNVLCRSSGWNRSNFRKGDVIAIPFHTANTNPHVDPNDPALGKTIWGPVYSKRRMVIVLWIHERDMFCLPLFTHNHTGLSGKGKHILHEYVSLKNKGDRAHVQQGLYPPVEVDAYKRPMDKGTAIQLTGGLRVSCNDDVTLAGRVTKAWVD
ncbi:hypothetical protein LTR78_005397 [Recurvomyces mirabilis]|uniref:DUF6590 domain-containing protein n=1 Tax=Recurvomyces mirabilis TaxID=574656 RepID=A0AAE0WN01_9PEZI|nr:hypothetical protein LTR78_005397 [Recurvomyces mirabilis]